MSDTYEVCEVYGDYGTCLVFANKDIADGQTFINDVVHIKMSLVDLSKEEVQTLLRGDFISAQ